MTERMVVLADKLAEFTDKLHEEGKRLMAVAPWQSRAISDGYGGTLHQATSYLVVYR